MPPLPATGGPGLSRRANELLDAAAAAPGARTPAEWAQTLGWDERLTAGAAAELEAAGLALPRDQAHLRLDQVLVEGEPPSWAYRRLGARSALMRAVVMAWVEGWRTVPELAQVIGRSQGSIRGAWRRLVTMGWAWRLGTVVPRQACGSETDARHDGALGQAGLR